MRDYILFIIYLIPLLVVSSSSTLLWCHFMPCFWPSITSLVVWVQNGQDVQPTPHRPLSFSSSFWCSKDFCLPFSPPSCLALKSAPFGTTKQPSNLWRRKRHDGIGNHDGNPYKPFSEDFPSIGFHLLPKDPVMEEAKAMATCFLYEWFCILFLPVSVMSNQKLLGLFQPTKRLFFVSRDVCVL